ncbi:flagellar biosynthesis regulator FlaF [Aestuariibius sp. HNIBRBA575]|uniref:flagellar biosynthesis regulator FlaF n=1 Tax=Aestuariibius sp. HNIBRBA575 TaxID=3233343 RepID=UPI0034A46710
MNAIFQAQQAYAPKNSPFRTGRSAEVQLFGQITNRLRKASQNLPASFPDLVTALHENRRMWHHFAAEVADDDNALPRDLRARLFYLAEFTDHHSRLALKNEADVSLLIEINTSVMRGLNSQEAS